MTTWPRRSGPRERAPDRGVHRLGARRREHDLARPRTEERGDLLARVFERDPRHPPFGVQPAGIGRGARGGYGSIASSTAGRRGADDAWSRYACGRHTRVTQCSSPPGRLCSIVGSRLAVEAFEHALDHAGVDRAQHVRVLARRFAERAVLGDQRERAAARLGVRGEAVRGQRVGDRRERGLHRTVALAGFHACRDATAVLVADLLGDRVRFVDRQPFERTREQRAEQVVAAGREREVRVVGASRGSASTAGPAALVARRARRRGSRRRELLEVVAGDVRVQGELLGDLGGLDAVRVGADEEVDVPPGRVAEGGR